jgi:NitT/TauT family transport system ATP-binding protein
MGNLQAQQKQTPVTRVSSACIVRTRSLSKTFRIADGTVTALREINVSINAHDFVSFVGPSGCGKSTLLNIIAGLLPPSSGQVELYGERITAPSRKIGFMFQTPVLLPWRTVEKNVLLPAEVYGLNAKDLRDKARSVIEAVGLKDFINAYPKQLSGGMQQRVALARVLTYEPEILLLDEPFGALDEFTREAMNLELMRITQSANITCIFVTHNISEAVFLSDKVVVMTPRPGEVSGIVDIGLARPRGIRVMHNAAFADLIFEVRNLLGRHIQT